MILILVHCCDLSVFKVLVSRREPLKSCCSADYIEYLTLWHFVPGCFYVYFSVAFCPAVNFLRGISCEGHLVRGILCCGILSRGIMSGIRLIYPRGVEG